MNHYKKGKNVEEELSKDKIPIPNLPKDFLWMHVKGGTKVSNVVDYAMNAFNSKEYRTVVWSGSGGGVTKTISCAEIMKRDLPLHQVTRLCYQKFEEYWEPTMKGLDEIVAARHIPCIHILLSLDNVDKSTIGYQFSQTGTTFWIEGAPAKENNNQYRKNRRRSEPSQHQQSSVKSNNKIQPSNENSIKSPNAKFSSSPKPDNSNATVSSFSNNKPNRYRNNRPFRQHSDSGTPSADQSNIELNPDSNNRISKKPFKHRSFGGNQNPNIETGDNLAAGELDPDSTSTPNTSRKQYKNRHSAPARHFANRSEKTSADGQSSFDHNSTEMTAGSSKQLYKIRSSDIKSQETAAIHENIAVKNEIVCVAGPSNASLSR